MVDYNLKDIIFSLDIGTRSIIGAVGVIKDNKFKVIAERYEEHEERAERSLENDAWERMKKRGIID